MLLAFGGGGAGVRFEVWTEGTRIAEGHADTVGAAREAAEVAIAADRVGRLEQACRICGCTDSHACVTDAGPCWWIEPDLCSACAEGGSR